VIAPERLEEFSPGADKDLRALIEATAAMEMADIEATFGRMTSSGG
jgi:Mn-containing catalase